MVTAKQVGGGLIGAWCFVACGGTTSTEASRTESSTSPATTSVASSMPSAAKPASTTSAAIKPAKRPPATECRVQQSGKQVYSGPCVFKNDGENGSFSIAPIGAADIAGANPITVSITEKGVAEVRGLTKDGINSRWGEAKRSSTDKACWTGSDFEICAYAGGAPKPSGKVDATASKAVEQDHGKEYWAVYLAKGANQDEPSMKAAIQALSSRGLVFGKTFGVGSLGCDVGAAAALKEKDDTLAIAAYFKTEADAKAFAATLQPAPLGVVKIKASCRD